jgi:hypothetical protein
MEIHLSRFQYVRTMFLSDEHTGRKHLENLGVGDGIMLNLSLKGIDMKMSGML